MSNPDVRRLLRWAVVSMVLVIAANAAAITVFVSRSDSARRHNCEITGQAIAQNNANLIEVAGRQSPDEVPRTAEEQAQFDAAVAEFSAAPIEILDDCR